MLRHINDCDIYSERFGESKEGERVEWNYNLVQQSQCFFYTLRLYSEEMEISGEL